MIGAIVVVAHLLGFISSIDAVMSTRTSQGAIAWAVVLNTFPYVAVPAYWVLGRSRFKGYTNIRQSEDAEVHQIALDVAEKVGTYRAADVEAAGLAAERLADISVLTGNAVELLIDGDATFASIFEGIDAAEDYVLVQFFIIKDDGLGRDLKRHLLDAANRGVRVLVLYDEVGSNKLPRSYRDELTNAGVQVRQFNTRQGRRNKFQLNFRNHRKIVVTDGKIAWVGGHNVGDEYIGKSEFGHWRDTHLRIEGPAALAAQFAFIEDWNWAAGHVPEVSWEPHEAPDSDVRVLIVPSGPADIMETAALMFTHAINTATERIWIASPYFVPDEAIIGALQLAGLRGVDVRILIPDEPDHMLVYLAAFSYFDEVKKAGVKFYRYTDGFLHQKAMLIDDAAAAVGTANFDNRSFRLNFEITAFIGGESFASEVEQMFLADFEHSRRMRPGELDEHGFWFKIGVRLARLTSPIL